MQVLKRPVQRVRLNQDYGLIKLEEVLVVRTHQEDSTCFTQAVTPLTPSIAIYNAWLGDENANEYTSIQCGQKEKLYLNVDCNICYTNYVTVECYAGKDTGWEHLIDKWEYIEVPCGNTCDDVVLTLLIGSGKVEDFLKKAGLDCSAKQVKVCAKVIYEG